MRSIRYSKLLKKVRTNLMFILKGLFLREIVDQSKALIKGENRLLNLNFIMKFRGK